MRTVVVTFESLPAVALGCYGAFQNQTPHFDAVAASGGTFDLYFAHDADQTLADLLPPANSLQLVSDQVNPASTSDVRTQHCNFCDFTSSELHELIGGTTAEILWLHHTQESLTEEGLMQALCAWDYEPPSSIDGINLAEAAVQLVANGLTTEQVNRVLVTALTVNKDRFLGNVWDAWTQTCQTTDRLIVSAVRGDVRLKTTRAAWVTSLSEPVMHLPLLVVRADQISPAQPVRHRRLLTSHAGLLNVVADESCAQTTNAQIIYQSTWGTAIRTTNWLYLHRTPTEAEPDPETCMLFAKPEDIWETLDVSAQYPGVVEEFQETLRVRLS